MLRPRLIPVLLLGRRGLVKTVRFGNATYLGDPLNTARIFSDLQADELVVLDIGATRDKRGPPFDLIRTIASECFVPLTYGGGIRSVEDARTILSSGVEKIAINAECRRNPRILTECAARFGRQSVVAAIDARRRDDGTWEVYDHVRLQGTGADVLVLAADLEAAGAGEIFLTAVDREGTMSGYDVDLARAVSQVVRVPVIVHGGAGSPRDLQLAVRDGGASAVACGSLFVFYGRRRAVLISYPMRDEILELDSP